MTIKAVLIEPDDAQALAAETLVAGLPGTEQSRVPDVAALTGSTAAGAELVVLGPGLPQEQVRDALASIEAWSPTAAVVLVREQVGPDLFRAAIRAGACDVLGLDEPSTESRAALERAVADLERVQGVGAAPAPVGDGAGRVVTVFSTKGGVGKTVLASNLGVALMGLGKRTVLVDLDLQFGDVAIMLGIQPEHTIADAAKVSDRLDRDLLDALLVQHPSGLKCLIAPLHPEEAESITSARITRILELLTQMFDVVLVDTSATLDDAALTALDASQKVLALTTMDVASIKNTRISLQKLHQLGYDGTSVHVVLNRADSKVFLQPSQVEKAIGRTVGSSIPSDRIVPQCLNKGVTVVTEAPKNAVARAMIGIAKEIADAGAGV